MPAPVLVPEPAAPVEADEAVPTAALLEGVGTGSEATTTVVGADPPGRMIASPLSLPELLPLNAKIATTMPSTPSTATPATIGSALLCCLPAEVGGGGGAGYAGPPIGIWCIDGIGPCGPICIAGMGCGVWLIAALGPVSTIVRPPACCGPACAKSGSPICVAPPRAGIMGELCMEPLGIPGMPCMLCIAAVPCICSATAADEAVGARAPPVPPIVSSS